MSAAIDKYVYVLVKPRFERQIRAAYSVIEEVDDATQIIHPIIQNALMLFNINDHIEVSSIADLPSRAGMGSSGAFTVGLVNALSVSTRKPVMDLAEFSYNLERNLAGGKTGKQDPYVAVLGGVHSYSAKRSGEVSHISLKVDDLDDKLILFYTGMRRSADRVLKRMAENTVEIENMQSIGELCYDALSTGNYDVYGELLSRHWESKRRIPGVSNPEIDALYRKGMDLGASGGKLLGAGGGGFFMFYAPTKSIKEKLISVLGDAGYPHQPFRFSEKGSTVINI